MTKPIVLFLCTGNSCRSQMAEAFCRSYANDRFEVKSAGTEPKSEIHPLALQVMAERGIDMNGQHPKGVREFLGRIPVRHLVIVCGGADQACPRVFPGMLTRDFWPLDDPAEAVGSLDERLDKFREIRDEIDRRIQEWLASPAQAGGER